MPGPLPDSKVRRQSSPTIPTTRLPSAGRPGRAPYPPSWVKLGPAGKAWWLWAWKTPQACGWGSAVGFEAFIARRAALEDDLSALDQVEGLDFGELADTEFVSQLKAVVARVAALATGRLAIVKEMREIDTRLGLTPKGLADLRWTIQTPEAAAVSDAAISALDDYRAARSSG